MNDQMSESNVEVSVPIFPLGDMYEAEGIRADTGGDGEDYEDFDEEDFDDEFDDDFAEEEDDFDYGAQELDESIDPDSDSNDEDIDVDLEDEDEESEDAEADGDEDVGDDD